MPPEHEAVAGEAGGGEEPVAVAGEHRDHSWAPTTTPPERTETSVPATAFKSAPTSPAPRTKADERPDPQATGLGRLVIGQGQVGGDLLFRVGSLGPLGVGAVSLCRGRPCGPASSK